MQAELNLPGTPGQQAQLFSNFMYGPALVQIEWTYQTIATHYNQNPLNLTFHQSCRILLFHFQ